MGCDFMQGFLLGRPLKPEAARLLLRKQQRPLPLLHVATKRPQTSRPTEYVTR
jgi:hypothetical protein